MLQDLDNETLEHINADNQRQTLEEELEFIKSVHDQVSMDGSIHASQHLVNYMRTSEAEYCIQSYPSVCL